MSFQCPKPKESTLRFDSLEKYAVDELVPVTELLSS